MPDQKSSQWSVLRVVATAVPLVVILAVVGYAMARGPIDEPFGTAFGLAGPAVFVCGLAVLPVARRAKREHRVDEAYKWMRIAMGAFLISAILSFLGHIYVA